MNHNLNVNGMDDTDVQMNVCDNCENVLYNVCSRFHSYQSCVTQCARCVVGALI